MGKITLGIKLKAAACTRLESSGGNLQSEEK